MESSNLTEKINTFTSLVLKDAEEKRNKLLENVQKEYTERIDAKETELLQEAYENIQQNLHDAQKDANARVLHAELDAKKTLILRREEIISEVMKAAKEKVVEFTKTDEYEKWLISKIEKALFEVGKGNKTVYISSDDIRLKEKIENIADTGKITVEAASEKDFIGGAKIINNDRKISVDYSFKEMLSEEKQKFLQSSGLALS